MHPAPYHGDRETYEDKETGRTVTRVWFQPDQHMPGKWLTAKEFAQVYNDPKPEAPPVTITGYRELTDDEKAMMNEFKRTSALFLTQCKIVSKHLAEQYSHAHRVAGSDELHRLDDACPHKWLAKANTSMQEACMFACRAVAQPRGDC